MVYTHEKGQGDERIWWISDTSIKQVTQADWWPSKEVGKRDIYSAADTGKLVAE